VFALQWGLLSIVCTALQRLLAQRDENRHVTTLLVAHLRHLALEIGQRAMREGRLAAAADIFFVSWDELPAVLADRDRDWRSVVSERRDERLGDALVAAPDLLRGDEPAEDDVTRSSEGDELQQGLGVSPGTVIGTVKVVRSAEDLQTLRGEIVVMPAIEPSLASIFPIVGGLVAEMGGILSHVAILAREYGLPAVVNVKNATRTLRDGDRVELNGTTGRVRVLGRRLGAHDGVAAVAEDHRGDHYSDQGARDHV
jgi:phosphohistidine swiveling domain-containing protein